MARGAAQTRKKAAKSQPGTRRQAAARRPPTIEQTMFFPRLRRQAKWVFVLLVFVFAGGFVFFGVGSGSTGLGDLLRNQSAGQGDGSTNAPGAGSALARKHSRRVQLQPARPSARQRPDDAAADPEGERRRRRGDDGTAEGHPALQAPGQAAADR